MGTEISIAFATDDNYAQHTAVAMASIMNNTNKNNTVTFYILQEDLSTMHKNMLTDTAIMNNCNIEFLQIMDPSMDELFVSAQLSKAAYYRLEMVKLLPDIVKKIIYLDCDLLVFKDIETLWSIDMENKPLAAVADLGIMASSKDAKKKEQSLGIKVGEPYFNSGMLIVDVEKWREANYADLVKEAAISHDYQHHDQDALNGVFYGNWKAVPMCWNVIPPVWNLFLKILVRSEYRRMAIEARRDIAILHYAGGYKPWEYKLYPEFNNKYYEYLEKTAYKDEKMPKFDHRKKNRSIARQLWRLRIADFWTKIFS